MSDFYKNVACELIKALRGERSQQWVNERLGHQNYNVVSRWETGQQRIYWKDFVELTKVFKIDVRKDLEDFYGFFENLDDQTKLVSSFVGDTSIEKAAKFLDTSTSTVQRLLRGATPLQLSTFLALLEYRGDLFRFAARTVEIKKVPSLFESYNQSREALQTFSKHPEASPIMLCFCLSEYKAKDAHEEGWVANKLGISKDKELDVIADLENVGLIEKENGRYVEKAHFLNLSYSKEDEKEWSHLIKENWIKEALSRFENRPHKKKSTAGFRIFAVDEHKKQLMEEEIKKFNVRLYQILETTPKDDVDQVCLFTYQWNQLV